LNSGWYQLTLTDDNDCVIMDSIFITEPATNVEATFDTYPITCFGGRDGRIHIFPIGGVPPYEFSIDNNQFSSAANIVGLSANEYPIIVRDDNDCLYETKTTVIEPDETTVDAGNDIELVWGESIRLQTIVNNAVEPILYQWSPSEGLSCSDCPNPVSTPEQDMFYNILIEDGRGCRAEDLVAVRLVKEHNIYVANAFTPNNDGVNDFLFVQSDENKVQTILRFEVFSRWGTKVFEARDIQPNVPELGWDGYFQGELMNTAVFGWVLEVEFLDGDVEIYKGNATLLRQ
jgi:gliding motility-associated-like protein